MKGTGQLSVVEDGDIQRSLFPESVYRDRPDLVELVKRGFNHTAERIFSTDEELCRRVVADLVLGHKSQRAIAREHFISRNSIAGIYEQLESRGLVEPLRKSLRRLLSKNALMMLEEIGDALSQGRLHPGQLSVPLSIHLQHMVALEAGNPSEGPAGGPLKELQVDQVREALESMKRAKVVTTHSE